MEKKIYYHDTDAGGVVYYGNYLKYMEEARTEFLHQRGLALTRLKQNGYEYVVRKCSLIYRRPARYGDEIRCEAHLKKMSATQLFFDQKVVDKKTGHILVEAEVSLACVSLPSFKPAPIPRDIADCLRS